MTHPLKIIFRTFILVLILGLAIYQFLPETPLPKNAQIDSLVVLKSKRQLLAFYDGQLLKTYSIALGRQPIGAKEYEGDLKTPEGSYIINDKNPKSTYYKNLGISYPNAKDIAHARKLHRPAGGEIKIHGLKNYMGLLGKFHRWFDWTLGCIAVQNSEIDELYNAVPVGTPIIIFP